MEYTVVSMLRIAFYTLEVFLSKKTYRLQIISKKTFPSDADTLLYNLIIFNTCKYR